VVCGVDVAERRSDSHAVSGREEIRGRRVCGGTRKWVVDEVDGAT
jgi:hypothetical protein